MSSSASSPEIDLSWQKREREARLLAELVRSSRLTVLYGDTGPGRTALLTSGVVPLLRRRESDAVGQATRESRVVIPFPDRRSRIGGRFPARPAELVVFFDVWSEQALAGLRNCILSAASARNPADDTSGLGLADMLAALGQQKNLQFLIVLDRFEQLIAPNGAFRERFIDEFCEAVNRAGLCANFLLSLSEDAKPRLDSLRRRIQGFDDFSVRLLRWNGIVERPLVLSDVAETLSLNKATEQRVPVLKGAALASVSAESKVTLVAVEGWRSEEKSARRTRVKLARAAAGPHVPIETKAVYAFIESTLIETAKASRFTPWQNVPHSTTHRATPALEMAKPDAGGLVNPDGAGEVPAPPPARDAQPRGASTMPVRQPAPENDEPTPDARAVASFVGVNLQSALKWLRRRIRPKQQRDT